MGLMPRSNSGAKSSFGTGSVGLKIAELTVAVFVLTSLLPHVVDLPNPVRQAIGWFAGSLLAFSLPPSLHRLLPFRRRILISVALGLLSFILWETLEVLGLLNRR
jgi:hypothetical protein